MKIVLYSTGCPRCTVLETKLKSKNIDFEIITNQELMIEKGFDSVPILEVEEKSYNFKEAIEWVNNYEH